jgi:hypothetical protein
MKSLLARLKKRLQALVSSMLDDAMEEQEIFERCRQMQEREKELLGIVDSLQLRIEALEDRQGRAAAFEAAEKT